MYECRSRNRPELDFTFGHFWCHRIVGGSRSKTIKYSIITVICLVRDTVECSETKG
jgi:hypothetical protein